mgnify:CR=1 FL=1
MKAVKVRNPASLDSLDVVDIDSPGEPGPGELPGFAFHRFAVPKLLVLLYQTLWL